MSELVETNYTVQFTSPDGSFARIFVENLTSSVTKKYDPESGELIQFYFGLVTTKDEGGDVKLARMKASMDQAGVHHHTYDAKSGAQYRMTRIGATKSRLMKYADITKFNMGLIPSQIESAAKKQGIDLENRSGVDWYPPYENLFAPYSYEKSYLYNSFKAGSCLTCFERLITGSSSVKGNGRGCGFDLNKLESNIRDNAFCLAIFPLHDDTAKENLKEVWMQWSFPWDLPTNEIKDYFGEEVGFYFKFLAHITSGFLFLTLFACAAQVVGFLHVVQGESMMLAEGFFAIFATCTYSVILDSWRYNQNKLAHLWQVFGCQKSLPPRPGFMGMVLKNPISGKLEIDFPESERAPRRLASLVASSTSIFLMLGTVLSIFTYKAILTTSGASGFQLLIPAILNSLQITVFGALYKYLAVWMTDFENHRSLVQHNSELFKKLTFFYFINYYASLFYIAFVKLGIEGCLESNSGSHHCGHELAFQVLVVFVGNDFANRMSNSVVVPFITRQYKAFRISLDPTIDGANMGPVERQFRLLDKYDPTTELIMDYIELFVQWGYLVMFGGSCPLVVALAAGTNFIETRTDGYKLLNDYRRVVPNQVDGIGEPLNVFYYVLYIAIPVNAGLFVYTFDGGELAPEYKWWIFMLIVVGLFFLLALLDTIFPEVPEKTSIQLQRQAVLYERVVLGNPDSEPEALDLDPSMIGMLTSELEGKHGSEDMKDMKIILGCEISSNTNAIPISSLLPKEEDKPLPSNPMRYLAKENKSRVVWETYVDDGETRTITNDETSIGSSYINPSSQEDRQKYQKPVLKRYLQQRSRPMPSVPPPPPFQPLHERMNLVNNFNYHHPNFLHATPHIPVEEAVTVLPQNKEQLTEYDHHSWSRESDLLSPPPLLPTTTSVRGLDTVVDECSTPSYDGNSRLWGRLGNLVNDKRGTPSVISPYSTNHGLHSIDS